MLQIIKIQIARHKRKGKRTWHKRYNILFLGWLRQPLSHFKLSHLTATNRQISGKYCRPQIANISYLSRLQQQQHEASRIVLAFGLETNSMTSLNINTRLLIALGIVIDFLDLERQPTTLKDIHTLELPQSTLAKCLYTPRTAASSSIPLCLSLSLYLSLYGLYKQFNRWLVPRRFSLA